MQGLTKDVVRQMLARIADLTPPTAPGTIFAVGEQFLKYNVLYRRNDHSNTEVDRCMFLVSGNGRYKGPLGEIDLRRTAPFPESLAVCYAAYQAAETLLVGEPIDYWIEAAYDAIIDQLEFPYEKRSTARNLISGLWLNGLNINFVGKTLRHALEIVIYYRHDEYDAIRRHRHDVVQSIQHSDVWGKLTHDYVQNLENGTYLPELHLQTAVDVVELNFDLIKPLLDSKLGKD